MMLVHCDSNDRIVLPCNKVYTLKNLIAKGFYYLPTSKYYHYDFVWKVISIHLVTLIFQNSFSSCFYKLKSKIYLLYRITNWLVRSTNSKVNITFHTYITIQFMIGGHPKTMWTGFWPFLTTYPPQVDIKGHFPG